MEPPPPQRPAAHGEHDAAVIPPSVLYAPVPHESGAGQLVVRSETTEADCGLQLDATPVEMVVTSAMAGAPHEPLPVPGPLPPIPAVADATQPPEKR